MLLPLNAGTYTVVAHFTRPPNTLATGADMSDGEVRHTAVDHSSAPHAMTRTYAGVSDAARKFLIDLSGSGIPLTCTKVFDQERHGY